MGVIWRNDGIKWLKQRDFHFSTEPPGYIIDRVGPKRWMPFHQGTGDLLTRPVHTWRQALQVCEIHAIQSQLS